MLRYLPTPWSQWRFNIDRLTDTIAGAVIGVVFRPSCSLQQSVHHITSGPWQQPLFLLCFSLFTTILNIVPPESSSSFRHSPADPAFCRDVVLLFLPCPTIHHQPTTPAVLLSYVQSSFSTTRRRLWCSSQSLMCSASVCKCLPSSCRPCEKQPRIGPEKSLEHPRRCTQKAI